MSCPLLVTVTIGALFFYAIFRMRSARQGYGNFNCNPADLVYSGGMYDTESRVLEGVTFALAVLVRFISSILSSFAAICYMLYFAPPLLLVHHSLVLSLRSFSFFSPPPADGDGGLGYLLLPFRVHRAAAAPGGSHRQCAAAPVDVPSPRRGAHRQSRSRTSDRACDKHVLHYRYLLRWRFPCWRFLCWPYP